MRYIGEYDQAAYNRFENLDSIELKIISHLVYSQTKHADLFWKLLKYPEKDALLKSTVTEAERIDLVCTEGYGNTKRLFMQPFTDDSWNEECCSVYIYVNRLVPQNKNLSIVEINFETLTHNKIAVCYGDAIVPPESGSEKTNPNDLNRAHDDIVVTTKNRSTLLLKCLLAELNGLYIDGVGYLAFDKKVDDKSRCEHNLFNSRHFAGHTITMSCTMAGPSSDPDYGF